MPIAAVVLIVLIAAALVAARWRGMQVRARVDEALAQRAAAGSADDLRQVGDLLAGGGRTAALACLAALRHHLGGRLAPAVAAGLRNPDPGVADTARQVLRELGAPGMRAAWTAYTNDPEAAGPARDRLRAFLLGNPDWLFRELFELWRAQGGAGDPPHLELWRDSGLRQRLQALQARGDVHVAPLAADLLRRLGAEPVPASSSVAAGAETATEHQPVG